MTGLRKTLPCGHDGTCVVGQFFVCDVKGCDGKMAPVKPNIHCPRCGSEDYYSYDSTGWIMGAPALACRPCGRVWSTDAKYSFGDDDDNA